MNNISVGIDDISYYLPRGQFEVSNLLGERSGLGPELAKRIEQAIESTGQTAMRLNEDFEDSVTMSSQALHRLLSSNSGVSFSRLRHLVSATETGVDASKASASYVLGAIKKGGFELPRNLLSYQVQHACAAGSIGLLQVCNALTSSRNTDELGIVLASDVARYPTPSTAEVTQGAGAVAVLCAQNPRLLSIDNSNLGYSSQDVDDFFRPLGSKQAMVRGQYSLRCFLDSAHDALGDFARNLGSDPRSVLSQTDYLVFHAPFAKMAQTAAKSILTKHLSISDAEVDEFLGCRGFFDATNIIAQAGNLYTASIFLNLMALLHYQYTAIGSKIVGKKVLLFSYGSGNTMVCYQATICESAPEVIKSWDFENDFTPTKGLSLSDYEHWACALEPSQTAPESVPKGSYYLRSIREDGYRDYQFNKPQP